MLLAVNLNRSMIDFMLKARKEKKTLKVRYGRVLFSGSSGAGKTSFYKLLLNRCRSEQHISTGLAQSEQVIAAVKVDVRSRDKHVELYELDIEHEILKFQSLLSTMANKKANNPTTGIKSSSSSQSNSELKLCDIELLMAREALVEESEKSDEINIFTFMDTGGQPQFISMIPAVNSSAMITFVVHDLQSSLIDRVKVSHGGEDGKQTFIPYTIGCTNLELIKSLVCFTNNIFLQKKPFLEEVCETRKKDSVSCLSFIGSHLDQVLAKNTDKEDSIHRIDETLDVVLKDAGLEHVWMDVHAQYKFLIPVNNLTSEDENDYGTCDSARRIRRKLYDKILQQEVYNVPIVWLLLELEIRRKCEGQKFITYNEIVDLCQEHDLIQNEDDIKNGLRFHHLFGVLLYFDEIPELCNYVFTDYQWLFNNLTEIVYQSYLNCHDNIKVTTEFKWKGFFTESLLDKCELKLKHKSGSLNETEIDFKQGFIKLLEHLRIIAPLTEGDKSIVYFMPSLLSTCDLTDCHCKFPSEVLPENGVICDKSEPLLVQFKLQGKRSDSPGSFPRGTFCCLIVQLLQDKVTWHPFWSNNKQKVFNNLVTLLHQRTGQYVTLIDRIFYLEVVMLQNIDGAFKSIHYEVKQILKNALDTIGLKLNFYKFYLTFCFICQRCLTEGKHVLLQENVSGFTFNCCHGHSIQKSSKYSVWDKVCYKKLFACLVIHVYHNIARWNYHIHGTFGGN